MATAEVGQSGLDAQRGLASPVLPDDEDLVPGKPRPTYPVDVMRASAHSFQYLR